MSARRSGRPGEGAKRRFLHLAASAAALVSWPEATARCAPRSLLRGRGACRSTVAPAPCLPYYPRARIVPSDGISPPYSSQYPCPFFGLVEKYFLGESA